LGWVHTLTAGPGLGVGMDDATHAPSASAVGFAASRNGADPAGPSPVVRKGVRKGDADHFGEKRSASPFWQTAPLGGPGLHDHRIARAAAGVGPGAGTDLGPGRLRWLADAALAGRLLGQALALAVCRLPAGGGPRRMLRGGGLAGGSALGPGQPPRWVVGAK